MAVVVASVRRRVVRMVPVRVVAVTMPAVRMGVLVVVVVGRAHHFLSSNLKGVL
jgi:hypothetical protein